MKKRLLILLATFLTVCGFAQNRYIVYFKDKKTVHQKPHPCDLFTPKALERRQLNAVRFDGYDLPVSRDYLAALRSDCRIINSSRWLNAAFIETGLSADALKNKFAFIQQLQGVHKPIQKTVYKFNMEAEPAEPIPERHANRSLPSYGYAEKQNLQIGTDCLHSQGFLGDNVLIAVLDAGWPGADTIPAFDSLHNDNRVLDTYNFLDMDTMVYQKFWHGTLVTSLMASNYPDSLVGTAPHASYMFYITEDVSVEVHQEEYNLILGLERADSMGAQVVSISLGYFTFDTLEGDYTYADMDGQTTICSQGIQVATSKGLIVLAAAGNSGPGHIGTPCDGDSILCVGATDTLNMIAGFSSVGPSYDGRVKPDISCVGKKAAYAGTSGNFGFGNGTSFATPLSAGMVACLVQAHPNRSAQEIIQSVRQSADRFNNPDSLYGYGIPNACLADSILTLLDWQDTVVSVSNSTPTKIEWHLFPNPADNILCLSTPGTLITSVRMYTIQGRLAFELIPLPSHIIRINIEALAAGLYLLRLNTTKGSINHLVSKTGIR